MLIHLLIVPITSIIQLCLRIFNANCYSRIQVYSSTLCPTSIPIYFPNIYISAITLWLSNTLFLYFLLLWLIGYRPLPTVPRGPQTPTLYTLLGYRPLPLRPHYSSVPRHATTSYTVRVPPPTPEASLALFPDTLYTSCWQDCSLRSGIQVLCIMIDRGHI